MAESEPAPALQRAYDNIWLIAITGTLFFFLSYVVWGIIDIFAVPAG